MATPPPNFRNAITEFTFTPLTAKTTSVPLDGRIFKAATLDAELSTELEDVTIFETARGPKSQHYVAFWCQLSSLSNVEKIKAKALKTDDNVSLYKDGCWDPTLVPHTLRKPPPAQASSSLASTSLKRRASTTSSLRQESITRKIPRTNLRETVEATVLPIGGSEENDVATWLNLIISSSTTPSDFQNQARFEGWDGPHLTRSTSQALSRKNDIRLWSSQYTTKLVENSQMSIKPDIVFCGQIDPHTGFAWCNVLAFFEVTSSSYSAQLRRLITRKAYAIFISQPHRCFVIALSLARQEFRLHIFDRSGAIHSLGHNIHKSADLFVRLIYTLACGGPRILGFDPTFIDPSLSPSLLFRPRSITAANVSRIIYINKIGYTVVRHIYVSHLIRGRATGTWHVRYRRKSYVIKDYWTHKGRKYKEEEILSRIKGLLGVPQLIEAWTVQCDDTDVTTDWLRPSFLVTNIEFETRIHRRLLMTPIGKPILHFSCLQEFISIFIDIVHVHFILVDVYGVLHRDISFNNVLMFLCEVPWPAVAIVDGREREEIIASRNFRRGLLIDFDYANLIHAGKQGVSSGDRTGTIPFMAIELLQQFSNPTADFTHTFSHDLESLIYVLVWTCVLYQAPNEVRTDRGIEETCLKQWALSKTSYDIQALCDQKLGQLSSRSVLNDFTPYFAPLKPTVKRLYKLIQLSQDPDEDSVLTHAAVMEVLLDAFNNTMEQPAGAKNAKRSWERMRNRPTASTESAYYSEGRSVRRKVM